MGNSLKFYLKGFKGELGEVDVYLIEGETSHACSATKLNWGELVYSYPPEHWTATEKAEYIYSYHEGYFQGINFEDEAVILIYSHDVEDEDDIGNERVKAWEDALETARKDWQWHSDWKL